VTLGHEHPISRAISVSIAALACAAGLLALPHQGAARADEPTAPVRLTITGLAPVALGAGTSLSMSGTIANTGLSTITSLSVRLVIATTPIADRRDLRKATEVEGAYGSIPLFGTTTRVVDSLPPGAKSAYRISIDAQQLPLGSPGVYVIGVEAVGFGPSGYVILDSARTLIPYVPDPPLPVNVTWLWPLATAPGQAPDDVLLGDTIPREIAPGGRLDDLVSAGESTPSISWVVDPQLLQVAGDMADGYLVAKGGQVRAGTGAGSAAAWLDRVRELLGEPGGGAGREARVRSLWAMPYADPDADALTRAGLTTDLVRATTASPAVTSRNIGREPDGTLAWAAGGRLDQAALDVLASAGVRTVVLRERALPTSPVLDYTPSGYIDLEASGGRVRALVMDAGLVSALALPQGNRATILAARQRFLAELAFVALEPTEDSRYLIAAPSNPRWAPNARLLRGIIASLRGTPWTRIVPVSRVLALPPTPTVGRLDPQANRGRELGAGYLARVEATRGSVESLRTVLTDPLPVTGPITSALLRAESSAWRTRVREGERLLDAIEASVAGAQSEIYVIPRDNIVFSGDRGSVPVTVANDFDQPVRVGITVSAEPAARLDAQPLPPVEIEPGRRASLEVPVRVIGGDALTVSVQLTDPSGAAFGEPASLELRTTAYSRAALWVAVGAAVILVLLVIFDIVRRGRARHARTDRVGGSPGSGREQETGA
jgi:hypothetical protein